MIINHTECFVLNITMLLLSWDADRTPAEKNSTLLCLINIVISIFCRIAYKITVSVARKPLWTLEWNLIIFKSNKNKQIIGFILVANIIHSSIFFLGACDIFRKAYLQMFLLFLDIYLYWFINIVIYGIN